MVKKISSLASAKILKMKLRKLLELLEENEALETNDIEFSSCAMGVVDFIGAVSMDMKKAQFEGASSYGMALLSIELSRPDLASYWWEADKKLMDNERYQIDEEEREFLLNRFEETRSRWVKTQNLE